ncbi:MAG TPA: serine/threonine-protein kinase [Gaiellaceae bacterium]
MSTTPIAGRYTLDRTLGRGGMASVYLGRDAQLERRVAVKLLDPSVARDDELRRRFARESRLAARLSHPNVVAVFDAGEDAGRPFIVMEYVEGETVADMLRRRGPLPPEEAAEIAAQTSAGLTHAHAHGLVHRDVKPQNLLVARDGRVKVADFGVARGEDTSRLTQAGTLLGTAAYLSPEQAAGAEIGPRSDLYSLGAVLYELLSGRTPYRFESLAELGARRKPPPPLPQRVPAALAAVVMRCLAPDPVDRPASAGELERDLRQTIGRASEAPTVAIARRPRSRRPLLVVAVLLAALAIALGVVLATRSGGTASSPPGPPPVQPVPHSRDTAQQARNLAEWLRRYSR